MLNGITPQQAALVESVAEIVNDAELLMSFEKDAFYQNEDKTYVRDLSGHGNDGVCMSVQFSAEGKVGGALDCRGGSLRIPGSMVNQQCEYTITFWVYVTGLVDQKFYEEVVTVEHGDDGASRVSVTENQQLYVGASNEFKANEPWEQAATPGNSFSLQEWHFVAITLQHGGPGRGDLRVVIDDEVYPLQSQMLNHPVRRNAVLLATNLNGRLDEVTVFRRALPLDEIATLCAYGRSGLSLPVPNREEQLMLTRRYEGHAGTPTSVAFTRDGRNIASSAGWPKGESIARVWDVATGSEVGRLAGHSLPIETVALAPTDQRRDCK